MLAAVAQVASSWLGALWQAQPQASSRLCGSPRSSKARSDALPSPGSSGGMPGEGAGEGMQAALQGADAGLGVADVARALVDACHMEEHKKVCVCVCVRWGGGT